MTINEIKQLITNDESRTLELKKSTSELVKGMQTLCAFLNTGVSRMVEACKDLGLPEPEYGTNGTFVWITFKRPNSVTSLDTSLSTNLDTNSVTDLSDKHKEILAYCIIARSSREVLEHIGVTNHTQNRDRFINYLINEGYIERTIPDIPNSSLQKYIKK